MIALSPAIVINIHHTCMYDMGDGEYGINSQSTTMVPCPHRIFDDLGSAFVMGCAGGSVWHYAKGMGVHHTYDLRT